MKKPFAWYGGKEALAPFLVSLLPRHKVYCEVFGGSGALLFAKPPGGTEIFNDLDSGVVNFFRVLRDPEQAAHLKRSLEMTPYAREEYAEYYYQAGVRKHVKKPFDHRRLSELLNTVKGFVALSYYPHPDLDRWYPLDKWRKLTWQQQKPSTLVVEAVQETTEMLLCNYPETVSLRSLWETTDGEDGAE